MGSLGADVLPRSERAAREMKELYGFRPLGFMRAVRRALADWEREEPLAAR
jgi:Ni,Fe-hydrogenase III component G